jgi:hypothetical protein
LVTPGNHKFLQSSFVGRFGKTPSFSATTLLRGDSRSATLGPAREKPKASKLRVPHRRGHDARSAADIMVKDVVTVDEQTTVPGRLPN